MFPPRDTSSSPASITVLVVLLLMLVGTVAALNLHRYVSRQLALQAEQALTLQGLRLLRGETLAGGNDWQAWRLRERNGDCRLFPWGEPAASGSPCARYGWVAGVPDNGRMVEIAAATALAGGGNGPAGPGRALRLRLSPGGDYLLLWQGRQGELWQGRWLAVGLTLVLLLILGGGSLYIRQLNENRKTTAELTASRRDALYRTIVGNLVEAVLMWRGGRIVRCNEAACQLFGISADELQALDEGSLPGLLPEWHWFDEQGHAFPPAMRPESLAGRTLTVQRGQVLGIRRHGEWRWLLVNAIPLRDGDDGPLLAVLASYSDITERKQAEERLALAGLVFETTTEGVVITDAGNRIVSVNPAFEQITGYRAQEVLGRDPSLLASGRQGAAFYETMWNALEQHGCWRGEIWNRRKDGEVYLEQLSIAVVRDRRGKIKRYVALLQDITEQNRQHEQMRYRAYHDALTDLPNRMLLGDRLQQALRQARRDHGQVAVLMIDLDGFKAVNDSLGHQAGDALLVEIAQRLRLQVRETDTVARLGGDEFTIVLPEVEGMTGAERVARAVCAAVAEPVLLTLEERTVEAGVSASLGIALYPAHAATQEELLRLADGALYAVKAGGRNGYRVADAAELADPAGVAAAAPPAVDGSA